MFANEYTVDVNSRMWNCKKKIKTASLLKRTCHHYTFLNGFWLFGNEHTFHIACRTLLVNLNAYQSVLHTNQFAGNVVGKQTHLYFTDGKEKDSSTFDNEETTNSSIKDEGMERKKGYKNKSSCFVNRQPNKKIFPLGISIQFLIKTIVYVHLQRS
jgi:hypothetical protein